MNNLKMYQSGARRAERELVNQIKEMMEEVWESSEKQYMKMGQRVSNISMLTFVKALTRHAREICLINDKAVTALCQFR